MPVDLDALRALLATVGAGKWAWVEDEFNNRIAPFNKPRGDRKRQRRAVRGRRVRETCVYWLVELRENAADEWDHRNIGRLAWSDIRGGTLINARPEGADAEAIIAAVNAAPALLEEIDRLRTRLAEVVEYGIRADERIAVLTAEPAWKARDAMLARCVLEEKMRKDAEAAGARHRAVADELRRERDEARKEIATLRAEVERLRASAGKHDPKDEPYDG